MAPELLTNIISMHMRNNNYASIMKEKTVVNDELFSQIITGIKSLQVIPYLGPGWLCDNFIPERIPLNQTIPVPGYTHETRYRTHGTV